MEGGKEGVFVGKLGGGGEGMKGLKGLDGLGLYSAVLNREMRFCFIYFYFYFYFIFSQSFFFFLEEVPALFFIQLC